MGRIHRQELPSTSRRGARCVTEEVWRRYCHEGSISPGDQEAKRKAFKRAAEALLVAELVGKWGRWVWFSLLRTDRTEPGQTRTTLVLSVSVRPDAPGRCPFLSVSVRVSEAEIDFEKRRAAAARQAAYRRCSRAIMMRAIHAPETRHAMLRLRANAARASLWLDTLPKVQRVFFYTSCTSGSLRTRRCCRRGRQDTRADAIRRLRLRALGEQT